MTDLDSSAGIGSPAQPDRSSPSPVAAAAANVTNGAAGHGADPTNMAQLHSLDFRLSWGECDPAGIVYFATWFPWIERVQTEWLYLAGERADHLLERRGVSMIVRRVTCDYLVPAMVFDPLRCSMSLGRMGTTSVAQSFTFTNRQTGAVHARAEMTVVFIDAGGRPTVPPGELVALWSPPGAQG